MNFNIMGVREKGFNLSVVLVLSLTFFILSSMINSDNINGEYPDIISDTTIVYDRVDDGKYIYDSIVSVRINDWDNHMTVAYDVGDDFIVYYTDKPIFNEDTTMCQLYVLNSHNSDFNVHYIQIDLRKHEMYLIKNKRQYITLFRKNYSEIKE